MSSSALPPLAGVNSTGARDDREEQRTQKVKPLPLMLSSRAPLVQAAGSSLPGGSPIQGASRSRPGGGPQQQAPQAHHHTHSPGPDVLQPPGSPTGQQAAALRSNSTKFTRIRGFQGGVSQGPLGLEGSGLLHPSPSQQASQQQQQPAALGHGGRQAALQQQQPGAGAGGHADSAQQPQHHSWDGGAVSPSLAASPPRLGSGGRVPAAAAANGGGGGGGSNGGAVAAVESWQQANGSSGGGAVPPAAAAAWAARRGGLAGPQRGRDASPFESGPAVHLGALGSPGGAIALAAIGSAPLAVRSSASAASAAAAAKHLSQLGAAGFPLPAPLHGPAGAGGARPDTAPTAASSAPFPLDALAATLPAGGAGRTSVNLGPHHGAPGPLGLVPAASINPPLAPPLAWPPLPPGDGAGGAPPPNMDELYGSGGSLPLQPGMSLSHSQDAATALEAGSPRLSLRQPRGPPNGPLPAPELPAGAGPAAAHQTAGATSSAAQLLQRLYRTNRTPPSQTESLQDLLGPPRHGSPAGVRTPVVTLGGGGVSRSDSPGPPLPPPGVALPSPAFPPPHAAAAAGGGGSGGRFIAGMSLSGATALASRPGTTGTVASSMSGGSNALLAQRPRGRNAAAGTLADLSAALQKSIAAGMGEWDLRADGSWGHPEVQQRLLRGPLGPEALKNRYRMEERDIIALYRLLYSYSVGFFTDVEALLEVAVADRSSSAAMGLAAGSGLRQELLENVFRAYATLWDEALMIVFDSEMTSMMADKNAALRALDRGAVQLETLKREKEELQSRLEGFMKQNVDNMLASRHLQQAATRLEGEVYTLHNANEQLVTNMARHAVHVATLERQLDAARAATEAAEARTAEAEAHLGDLRAIVSEQNATLASQFFQIKELERMCGELQETVRNLNRRRAAVLGLLSGNNPDHSDAGGGAHAAAISATTSVTSTSAAAAAGAPASPTTAPRSSTATGAASVASAGPSPLGGGASMRALGSASGAASGSGYAGARPGTGDGGASVARPGTPTPGAPMSSAHPSAPPAAAPAAPVLDSATEGVLADMSLLDPDELGRLLSDKTRAFNLMHADFIVKMHELDNQRSVNESLRAEVAALKAEVVRSEDAAAASKRTAAQFRAKYESGRMAMEDLEEKNRKLTHKNADLVRSYWPLMTRLKEAEEEAARCREEAAHDREAAAADREAADALRAAAAGTAAALQELEERRAEAASHELELPADLLALLPEGQVAALRRFSRSCHRRVAHLNGQVVALVDQVTQLRLADVLKKEAVIMAGGGAPAGAAAAAAGGFAATADAVAAELSELRTAVAARDKWLAVAVRGMSGLMGQMENLMARDWETCRTLRLEQDRRRRQAAREARMRAAAAAAGASAEASGGSGGSDGGGGGGGSQVGAERSSGEVPTAERSAASLNSTQSACLPAVTSSSGQVAGEVASPVDEGSAGGAGPAAELSAAALSDQQQQQQQPGSGAASAEASFLDGSAAASEGPKEGHADDDDGGGGGGDEALSVAAGRLAQLLGVGGGSEGVERSPELVSLDRAFERLAESAERLIEWSEGLLRRKEQTATFTQVRQRLDTVTRQLDAASVELSTLRPTAEALRHSVKGYEAKFKEMSANVASCKQRAETAESRLESVEAQLSVVTGQLRDAQDAQKLLENEYWKAKDVALEAEVTTGELKAGRIRALEAAAKALASVSGLQKEARENRDQRVALEADLVGYKAWVRHMEAIERKHRATLGELAEATSGCEERDRKLAELKDRITTLEQQLRFKSLETTSLESRVKALSGELVEERRAARAAVAEARAASAMQLDAAIRQAGAAEAEAAARAARVAVLEGRLSELTRELDAAQAAATAAESRLLPLTAERNRLRAHVAASQPLLAAMDRATDAIGRRLAKLEDGVAAAAASGDGNGDVERFGLRGGSLDVALEGLLGAVDRALDACGAVAAESAGDSTPAVLGELEGLAGQLLATLSKGGKEPIQSLAVLKAQLARDDREVAALRAAMAEVAAAREEAAREAAEHRAAAAAATKAAAAATAAAARDGARAAAAAAALAAARRDVDATVRQLAEARLEAEAAKRQAERSAKRSSELEADLASAHSQCRHQEATAAAAAQKAADLKRLADDCEEEALKDRDAAREARERAAAAEASAEASARRCAELEAAVEAEAREAARARADAAAAVEAAAEARDKAVAVEQAMLETQSKYADMIRHDEAIEERLRQAQFEADNMRKRAAEAAVEAAEAVAAYEELQQRAWQLQVALAAKAGEKEEALRELVEATHGAAARRAAATAVGSASVKQRAEGSVHESASSFKAKRTGDG